MGEEERVVKYSTIHAVRIEELVLFTTFRVVTEVKMFKKSQQATYDSLTCFYIAIIHKYINTTPCTTFYLFQKRSNAPRDLAHLDLSWQRFMIFHLAKTLY